jgi:hypothetical protein
VDHEAIDAGLAQALAASERARDATLFEPKRLVLLSESNRLLCAVVAELVARVRALEADAALREAAS